MDQQGNSNVPIPPIENPMATQPEGAVVPAEVTPVPDTTSTSRKFSPLVIGLGVLLLLFLFVTGFMAYQNMQLRSEVEALKAAQVQESELAMIEPTPTATPDPMAGWETYTNTEYGYTITHPSHYKVVQSVADAGEETLASPESRHIYFYNVDEEEGYLNRVLDIQYIGLGNQDNERTEVEFMGLDAFMLSTADEATFDVYQVSIPDTDQYLEFMVTKDSSYEELVDQILSTFEFTEN